MTHNFQFKGFKTDGTLPEVARVQVLDLIRTTGGAGGVSEAHVRAIIQDELEKLGGNIPVPDPDPGSPNYSPPTPGAEPVELPEKVEMGHRFVDSNYFARPSSATDLWAWKPVVTGAPQVTDVTHNGAHTVLLDRLDDDARISENVTAIDRKEKINATVWVRAPQGRTAQFRLFITSIAASGNTRLGYGAPWLTVTDGDWIKVAISVTVPADADGVQVRAAHAGAPVYISDAEMWVTRGISGQSFTLNELNYRAGETYSITQTGNPREVVFSPDGQQFSVVERASQRVTVHHLSLPWDITTAQPWRSRDFILPSAILYGHGHAIRPDGMKMWVYNRTEIWQWDLTEPWVPATAANAQVADLTGVITRGHDIDFKTDGKQLYIDDRIRGTVDMFTLGTAWDITTATHTASRVVTRQAAMRGIEMSPDGTTLFQLDTKKMELWQYTLNTPWDITTMQWVQTRSMAHVGNDPRSITWAGDGASFYVTDATSGEMFRMWALS